jgi:hypothetical protein
MKHVGRYFYIGGMGWYLHDYNLETNTYSCTISSENGKWEGTLTEELVRDMVMFSYLK